MVEDGRSYAYIAEHIAEDTGIANLNASPLQIIFQALEIPGPTTASRREGVPIENRGIPIRVGAVEQSIEDLKERIAAGDAKIADLQSEVDALKKTLSLFRPPTGQLNLV